jgi:hypothetical protein
MRSSLNAQQKEEAAILGRTFHEKHVTLDFVV